MENRSYFLQNLTDAEVMRGVAEVRDDVIARTFPGNVVNTGNLRGALAESGADFLVEKHPLLVINHIDGFDGLKADNVSGGVQAVPQHVATVRTDTMGQLGIVGKGYGVVQTLQCLESCDIMASRGDIRIVNVALREGGARVRVTAVVGTTHMESLGGAPNTLAHFAIFEAAHDGKAHSTVTVFTLRLECFNGMTSRKVVKVHKIRHTSQAANRVEAMTEGVLQTLLGDVEAEIAVFQSLVEKRMSFAQFTAFSLDMLGGELDVDAAKATVTRQQNKLDALTAYWLDGNQGAGATAWGAFNSWTRYTESIKEQYGDAKDVAKRAAKFDSNLDGTGQVGIARALKKLEAF